MLFYALLLCFFRAMAAPEFAIALPDETATRKLGLTLGQILPAGSVLLLQGDLGSGKTTLVQGLGQGLGITDPISSPTFILLNEYLEGRIPLYHLDLYRLEPAEVSDLHLDTYWEGLEYPPGIVAIEWAERLQYLPPDYVQIRLTIPATGRRAQIVAAGQFPAEVLAQVQAAIA
jgi:tRNA threonylcarbamoyladenosine biosynthesis protein TsaE